MCLTHCCQVFFLNIEGLNRTSIHAQNNQSMLHALWPRRHCATAPSKDTFHGIFAILLFLPQASIHIQSFELHGMKTIPPKKRNKRTSICISSTIMFNGFFDFFWQTSCLERQQLPPTASGAPTTSSPSSWGLRLGRNPLWIHQDVRYPSWESYIPINHPCDWNIYLHLP